MAESKWSEIRNDYVDETKGIICIDAWRTPDDDEQGRVIAEIDCETGTVRYIDADAETDAYAQEIISETLEKLRKNTGRYAIGELDEESRLWRVNDRNGGLRALISDFTGTVTYVSEQDRDNAELNALIAEKKSEIGKCGRISLRNEQGTRTVYFDTREGRLVIQIEDETDTGTGYDAVFIGIRPKNTDSYFDLAGVCIPDDRECVNLRLYDDPCKEDPTVSTDIVNDEFAAAERTC